MQHLKWRRPEQIIKFSAIYRFKKNLTVFPELIKKEDSIILALKCP